MEGVFEHQRLGGIPFSETFPCPIICRYTERLFVPENK